MGDLSYNAACSEHGQQNTVLVRDKTQVFTESRDICIGERLTIEGIEEIAGTTICLDTNQMLYRCEGDRFFFTIRKVSGKWLEDIINCT